MTTVATDWLTLEAAADLTGRSWALKHLARTTDPDVAAVAAALYTHPSLDPEAISLYWEDYATAITQQAQLDVGDITWADVAEDLVGEDKTEWAREILDMRAEDALHVLLHGLGGAR
jgi:hypothetical protein